MVMGLACYDPCATCFCTSTGAGPFDTAGLDVLLTERGENYLVQTVMKRGNGS